MSTLFNTSPKEHLNNIVRQWAEHIGLTMDAWGMLRLKGEPVTTDYLKREFRLDAAALRDPRRGITAEATSDALDRYLDLLSSQRHIEVAQGLAYKEDRVEQGREAMRDFLICLKGAALPEEMAVMEHFIWQVKRKLMGAIVTHHLMPLITGPQGTGKSTLIQRLLEPVRPLTLQGRPVDFVTDERNFKALSENYVVFFDEMSRASKTDADRLKEIISALMLSYRPLHTNNSSKSPQNCTFIGAANKDIRDLIYDPTGMRRFYQIRVDKVESKEELHERWALLNTIDVKAIWQSIDESVAEPSDYLKWLPMIEEKQQEFKAKTSFDEFIEERQVEPDEESKALLKQVYDDYTQFCVEAGRKDPIQRHTFSRELQSLGFERFRTSNGVAFKLKYNNAPRSSLKLVNTKD